MYTGHALDVEGFITIGDIIIYLIVVFPDHTIFGMVGAIYGSETTMIKKNNFSFCSKDKRPF